MKKDVIKICYRDWWDIYTDKRDKDFKLDNNVFVNILKKYYKDVIIDYKNPDITFASVQFSFYNGLYTKDNVIVDVNDLEKILKYICELKDDSIIIRVDGECYINNSVNDLVRYEIGYPCRKDDGNFKYCYFPNYLYTDANRMIFEIINQKYEISKELLIKLKSRFCSFFTRHESEYRDNYANMISTYKEIDWCGRYNNNIELNIPNGLLNKLYWNNLYKFNLSFENSDTPMYITEKIFDSFASLCIPIYKGNSYIKEIINDDAYINLDDYDLESLIEYIKEIDNNDDLFYNIIKTPIFKEDNYIDKLHENLEKFIYNILEENNLL